MSQSLMSTYARLPVGFVRGEGVWLWDTAGRKFLDAIGGLAVCGLGHAHPAITATICEQAAKLLHTSNLFEIGLQGELAERLTGLSSMDAVFFGNSGAEANEAAIKLARLHGHNKGIDAPAIIVAEGSFHGRTLATLSATGNRKVQAGFEPLVQGFVRVPYGDAESLAAVASERPDVVAVLLEPIQGEGGVVVPDPGYLNSVRACCDANGWLMILDEIQTGLCRTGRWFAWQHEEAEPDIMTLAKGLGNGVPIGACLARGDAAEVFGPGAHGSTFGGNPLACAVALRVLETMEEQSLAEAASRLGAYLMDNLTDTLSSLPIVREVRGRGLMVGIELDRPCTALAARALDHGVILNVTAGNVIRLLPPLTIGEGEIDRLVATIGQLVSTLADEA